MAAELTHFDPSPGLVNDVGKHNETFVRPSPVESKFHGRFGQDVAGHQMLLRETALINDLIGSGDDIVQPSGVRFWERIG